MDVSIKNNIDYKDMVIKDFECIKMSEDKYIYIYGPVYFPLSLDFKEIHVFNWYVWKIGDKDISGEEFLNIYGEDNGVNCDSVLIYGDIHSKDFMVRIHSGCITGDVFRSAKCDCGFQLNAALRQIVANGAGMVIYVSSQEGRGIGLFAKAICNKLQEQGMDTYIANNCLGFDDDERKFDEEITIIEHFRKNAPIILMTNNPYKIKWLKQNKIEISRIQNIVTEINVENKSYLLAKKLRGENVWNIEQ